MTLEPPKGLRANLLRSYQNLDDRELNNCKQPEVFKKLLFGFCIFHAIIQERRKFGPIGWNVGYDFTNEDLNVCKRQLKLFLDEYDHVPYKVINYLGAEINYGGRVTNDKDKTLISEIIQTYIRPEALADNYAYSVSGIYYSPPADDQSSYIRYIEALPLNVQPEAFGMHDNADITNAQNETRELLENV
jgi:dynein heavy chain